MPCKHKRVWETMSMRTGLPDDFNYRNPYDQALVAELYSITGGAGPGPGPGWEPYGIANGITHYKREKPCEECGKTNEIPKE